MPIPMESIVSPLTEETKRAGASTTPSDFLRENGPKIPIATFVQDFV
jgi:hypothetical protein